MKYERVDTSKREEDSSEDEEDYIIHHTLDRRNIPLLPIATSPYDGNTRPKKNTRRFVAYLAISAVVASALLLWLSSSRPIVTFQSYSNDSSSLPTLPNHLRRIAFDEALGGKFSVRRHSISWLDEAGDGVYSEITHRGIILNDLKLNSTKTLISSDQLVDPFGNAIFVESFTVSSDLRYVLVATDSVSQWRHSKFSKYLIYDTLHRTVVFLRPELSLNKKAVISIAQWSPTGHAIAYVMDNDIYLITSPVEVDRPIRLTTSGTATIFNGICDWVYEEEVFSASEALWWSPDSSKLVWLSLDESHVPVYKLNIFNPSNQVGKSIPYPEKVGMKYPKPGFNNPIVSVELFDLKSFQREQSSSDYQINPTQFINQLKLESEFNDDDRIVMEVAWVDAHQLIVRYTNRIATLEKTGYFDVSDSFPTSTSSSQQITYGKLVMDIDFVKFDGGWAEPGQYIKPIKLTNNPNGSDLAPGYLDVRINKEGFRHIAYFSPPDSNQPVFLSHGRWEVDGEILAVDFQRKLVYFIAANPSMERHLYSVKLPTRAELNQLKSLSISSPQSSQTIKLLTNGIGYYSASFSALAGFYLLDYHGPQTPWQKLVQVDDSSFDRVIENNSYLAKELKKYALPQVHHASVNNSVGQEMNVQEIRPFGMDLSGNTKYPVLFKVYGGPNSQMATTKFEIAWSHFLASSLDYIIVHVDGRGTGFKGREYRVGVRNQLGFLEALDVSTAAQFSPHLPPVNNLLSNIHFRYYASLKYVDPNRIGIWDGGYLTCKTVESYSKDFSVALAVAPVTDWRFYDSIYTERYMSTPQLNPKGYEISAINRMTGFGNLSFSLAHGSADDNAHLLDRLTGQQIRGFQFRLFPDSDHSISTRGAYRELMIWMTDFLLDKWGHGLSHKTPSQLPLALPRNKQVFNLSGVYDP